MPLMQVMNGIAFEEGDKGEKFNANFISILNKESEEFEYYIQRLLGKDIENETDPHSGKLWVPYINDRREDWSFMCENNRIVAKEDAIVFRYEGLQDNFNAKGLGGNLPDETAVGTRMPSSKMATSRAVEMNEQ